MRRTTTASSLPSVVRPSKSSPHRTVADVRCTWAAETTYNSWRNRFPRLMRMHRTLTSNRDLSSKCGVSSRTSNWTGSLRVRWLGGPHSQPSLLRHPGQVQLAVEKRLEIDIISGRVSSACHDRRHSSAELIPPCGCDRSSAANQGAGRDELDIVQVRNAASLEPFWLTEEHFGGDATDCRCNRSYEYAPEARRHSPSGEHYDGADFIQVCPPHVSVAELGHAGRTPWWGGHACRRRRCRASSVTSLGTSPS